MRIIDCHKAKKAVHEHKTFMMRKETVLKLLDEQPTVDTLNVINHGKWVAETERTGTYAHCSECGCRCAGYTPNYKFCPNCGAKMDLEE